MTTPTEDALKNITPDKPAGLESARLPNRQPVAPAGLGDASPYRMVAQTQDELRGGPSMATSLGAQNDNNYRDDIGRAQSAAGQFSRGLGSIIASTPKAFAEVAGILGEATGIGRLPEGASVEENPFYKAGERIQKFFNAPINPKYENEFNQQLASGAGSLVGFAAGGMAGKFAKLPTWLVPASFGSAAEGSALAEDYARTQEANGLPVDPTTRAKAFGLGSIIGTSEAFPIYRLIDRIDGKTGGAVSEAIKKSAKWGKYDRGKLIGREAFKGGVEEMTQEVFQNVAGNYVANGILEYDKERNLFTGAKEGGEVGFTLGFLFNALGTAVATRRSKLRKYGLDDSEGNPDAPTPPPGNTPGRAPWENLPSGDITDVTIEGIDVPVGGLKAEQGPMKPVEGPQRPQDTGIYPVTMPETNAGLVKPEAAPEVAAEPAPEAQAEETTEQPPATTEDTPEAKAQQFPPPKGMMPANLKRAYAAANEDASPENLIKQAEALQKVANITSNPAAKKAATKGAEEFKAAAEQAKAQDEEAEIAIRRSERAKEVAKKAGSINTQKDDIRTAIAKMGGLDAGEAMLQGVDDAAVKETKAGIRRVFTQNGNSFDDMAEKLDELGYDVKGEDGKYDLNRVLDHVTSETKSFSNQGGEDAAAERMAEERQADLEMQAKDEAATTEAAPEVAPAAQEEAEAAPGKALFDLYEKYDGTGEVETIQDLVDEVDALGLDETQGAVDAYREWQDEDRELGGRGDPDQAEEEFISAIKAHFGTAPTAETPPAPVQKKQEVAKPPLEGEFITKDRAAIDDLENAGYSVYEDNGWIIEDEYGTQVDVDGLPGGLRDAGKAVMALPTGDEAVIDKTEGELPKPKAPEAIAAPAGAGIGTNADGETIYEDKDGVRYIKQDGVQVQQKVELRPTRAGYESIPVPEARFEPVTAKKEGWTKTEGARTSKKKLPVTKYVDEQGDGVSTTYTLIRDDTNGKIRIIRDVEYDDGEKFLDRELVDEEGKESDRVWSGQVGSKDVRVEFASEQEAIDYIDEEGGGGAVPGKAPDIALEQEVSGKPPKKKTAPDNPQIAKDREKLEQDNFNLDKPEGEISTADEKFKEQQGNLIDAAANEAATSPQNDLTPPTDPQKENGKYKKGPIDSKIVPWLKGLKIMIENPAGSKRQAGWKALRNHYGYFQSTEAFDGDEVDVFLGPEMATEPKVVYVVNQVDPKTGKFDEHKVMLGFKGLGHAETAYMANYNRGWQGYAGIETYTYEEFKAKLKSGFFKNSTPARKLKKPSLLKDTRKGVYGDLKQISRVTTFASGMSRLKDFDAAEKAQSPIGVDIGQLSTFLVDEFGAASSYGTKLFVDSGAFGIFKINEKAKESGQEALPGMQGARKGLNFKTIMQKYKRMAAFVKDGPELTAERLLLVGPDVVGDQAESIRLTEEWAESLRELSQITGVDVIIPLQAGDKSLVEAYDAAAKVMENRPFRVGIPSNAMAVSDVELANLFRNRPIERAHILGAAKEKTLRPRLEVINEASGRPVDITADANLLRSALYASVEDRPALIAAALAQEGQIETKKPLLKDTRKPKQETKDALTDIGFKYLESDYTYTKKVETDEFSWLYNVRKVNRDGKPRYFVTASARKGTVSTPSQRLAETGSIDIAAKMVADHIEEHSGKKTAPAPKPKKKLLQRTESAETKKAQADLDAALADLGDILINKNTLQVVPVDQAKLMPVLTRVLDAAFRLGYHKFKDASKFALDTIRAKFGDEAADAITLDHLQGSYIGMAGGKDGADTKIDVVSVESIDEIMAEQPAEQAAPPAPKGKLLQPKSAKIKTETGEADNERPDIRINGPQALERVAAGENTPAGRSGDLFAGNEGGGGQGTGRDNQPDAAGVAGARSGGIGTAAAHTTGPGRGGKRAGRGTGRGTGRNGEGVSGEPTADSVLKPEERPTIPAANFKITEALGLGKGSEAQKYNDNVAAIRTLQAVTRDNRRATPEEQAKLAKYVGWGGMPNAFADTKGAFKKGWEDRGAEIADLLDEKQLAAARSSTRNAHYTSETIINSMWSAIKQFGHRGGISLEQSAGVGNVIGLKPEELTDQFVIVEFDDITAAIAKLLYPQSTVLHSGYQKVPIADGAYDLVAGNVPFGKESLNFRHKPELRGKSIHNQFFIAGLDALKPGGIMAQVVSRYLMDAKDSSSRVELAKRGRLLGAIRLPDTAFKENARTEVVTDILYFQRYDASEEANAEAAINERNKPVPNNETVVQREERQARERYIPDWLEVGTVDDPLGGDKITVNNYFVNRPDMIAGTLERSGSMRFKNDVTVRLDKGSDLGAILSDLTKKLPSDIINQSDEALQSAKDRYKRMVDSLEIALSGAEVGAITRNQDGTLNNVYERETPEGDYELSRRALTESSPWSNALEMNSDGKWFMKVRKLDEKGKPVKEGRFNVYERKVFEDDADIPKSMLIGKTMLDRLNQMVDLRDSFAKQIQLEAEDATSDLIEANRKVLSDRYSAFVKKNGFVNAQKNAKLVAQMPDAGLVMALEMSYRKEQKVWTGKKMGKKKIYKTVRPEEATPADILKERVKFPYKAPSKAESPSEALAISLSEQGVIDMARVSELLGITEEQAIDEMFESNANPLIFKNPESNQWEMRDIYLTGTVTQKLKAAQAQGLTKHIEALEKVQPEPIGAEHVTPAIGMSWIKPDYYADFLEHLTGERFRVSYSRLTNSYEVTGADGDTDKGREWAVLEGERMRALPNKMVSDLLNSKQTKIWDHDHEGNRHLNQDMTDLAILMREKIEIEFTDWAFQDSDRRKDLVDTFNLKFNTRIHRQYDGSHMVYPGKVPDSVIKFRRHQQNAIWRGIFERFMLLDHAVGSGKTYTAIARAMERRRMGLSRKPMIVVPNHMVDQFTADIYRLYPAAKVLSAGKKDLSKARRRRMFARIASGDWDIVVMPHSSFGFIQIAPETEERYLREALDEAAAAVQEAWEVSGEEESSSRFKPFNVKEAERVQTSIEAAIDKLLTRPKDRLLTFEQMGVDDLTMDEAHEFKNLQYNSSLTGVRGMNTKQGSKRAFDLNAKIRTLRETPTGTVTFMTGTPISNSAVEMYTIMRYLANDEINDLGLEHFDAWRSQYVNIETKYEPNDAGRLHEVNRLGRSWANMRSLMDLYYSFTDAVTNEDIKEAYRQDHDGAEFPIPKIKGGARQTVAIKPTQAQEAELTQVLAGFESLPNEPDPIERNKARLRLMDRARKLSLDVRAVNRFSNSKEEGGKLEVVSGKVFDLAEKWKEDKGTQLVFIDRSVPKANGDKKLIKDYDALVAARDKALRENNEDAYQSASDKLEKYDPNEMEEIKAAQNGGWNAYQQIKDNLIAKGMNADEIRFIQEANTDIQKQALFDAVNAGEVRVLIGSTPRMGAGTNVQQRLVGLHHVDVTWKPSDIEQREGRIIRQGNLFNTPPEKGWPNQLYRDDFEVDINAYVTERTVDAKMWDINSTKLSMINAIRHYDGSFEMEFDDTDSISMAEIAAIATGDPLMLERVELTGKIKKLRLFERQYQRKMWAAKGAVEDAERAISEYPAKIKRMKAVAKDLRERVDATEKEAFRRKTTVEGKEYDTEFHAMQAYIESMERQQEESGKKKFAVSVDGKRYTNKAEVEAAIKQAIGDQDYAGTVNGIPQTTRIGAAREMAPLILEPAAELKSGAQTKSIKVGTLYGYDLEADIAKHGKMYYFSLSLVDDQGSVIESIQLDARENANISTVSFVNQIANIQNRVKEKASNTGSWYEKELKAATENLPEYKAKLDQKFDKAEELEEAEVRLELLTANLAQTRTATGQQAEQMGPQEPVGPRRPGPDGPVFSKYSNTGRKIPTGVPMKMLRATIEEFSATFDNWLDLDFLAFETKEEAFKEDAAKYADETVKGAYWGKSRVAAFIADQMNSKEEILETLRHEIFAHHGLNLFKPAEKRAILDAVSNSRNSRSLKKIWEKIDRDYADQDETKRAEEVIALIAESKQGRITKAWADIVYAIKKAMKAMHLIPDTYSKAELQGLINEIQVKLKRRDPMQTFPETDQAQFDTEGSAFKRWFGNSKVVDENGDPIVFYHYSRHGADIKEFKAGTHDLSMFGIGIHVGDKQTAQDRAKKTSLSGSTYPVFIKSGKELLGKDGSPMAEEELSEYLRNIAIEKYGENFNNYRDAQNHVSAVVWSEYDSIPYVNDVEGKGKISYIIPPKNIKSAIGNRGTFDPNDPNIMFSRTRRTPGRQYTPAQEEAIGKGFADIPDSTLLGGLKETADRVIQSKQVWKTRVRQGIIDQYDSFRTILNDKRAWMMSEMVSPGGAIESALEFGSIFLSENAIDTDTTKKSLREIVEPLGDELDDFLRWIAGNRSARLKLEDRERLFEDIDIAALKSLNQGTMEDGRSRQQVYSAALKEFEELNNAIVQIGVDTGLISADDAKLWKSQGFYVPFYRLAEKQERIQGPVNASGLVKQTAYKRLRGANIPINDLLSNVVLNWSHIVGAGLKNQAAVKALSTAEHMGLAERLEPDMKPGKDAVYVRWGGQEVWYELDGSQEGNLVLESLVSLNWTGLNNFTMQVMRKFKRGLTYGVTAAPEFKIANLIRDTVQAIAVAGMSVNIAKNLARGFRATKKGNPTIARMIAGGGAFGDSGYIHGSDPEGYRRSIERDVSRMTLLDTPGKIRKMWEAYQDFGARLENVNRAANFEQDLAAGKDLLEANFNARDHLDFQRNGSFIAIRAITQVVPFLNARLQGLDKLARAAADPDQRRQFASVVASYSLMSVLLYLYMRDDDDYKEAQQWERDTYHLFKLPGSDIMYRIPRPFEVGFMASMVERAAEQMVDDEVHGHLFAERLWHGLTETLSFNPMPQAFLPALEVWANQDIFTKRPIESMGMRNLSPSERRNAWTSSTAIGMSRAMDSISWGKVVLSPVQIEHLVNGYLGWMGATTLASSDLIVSGITNQPAKPARTVHDFPIVGRFARPGLSRSTQYTTAFYDNMKEANQAYYDIRQARRMGQNERAFQMAEDTKDKLAWRKAYNKGQKLLSDINKDMNALQSSRNLDSQTKREMMNVLNRRKNAIAARIVQGSSGAF